MPSALGTNGDDTFFLPNPRVDPGTFWGENGVDTLVIPGNSSDYSFYYSQPLNWVQGVVQQPRLQVALTAEQFVVAELRSVEFIQFDDRIVDVSTLRFTLTGTNANDILLALYNGSTLYGGDGNDDLVAYEGNDTLYGGNGDDVLTAWPFRAGGFQTYDHWGNDFFDGGKGIDTLQIFFAFQDSPVTYDFLKGGPLTTQYGSITLKNIEQVIVQGARNFSNDLAGGNFADQLTGGNLSDILNGRGGNDVIYGGEGQDTIFGGSGNDEIWGDDSDFLTNDDDRIFAGDGDDWVYGAGGSDYIEGGDGNDVLMGGKGFGSNVIYGGAGNDTIIDAAVGPAYLDGGSGNDYLEGSLGDDRLIGGSGNDSLFGGDGWDTLSGGSGSDTLRGGYGADELTGGPGADKFSYPDLDDLNIFGGIDTILDFSFSEGDKIDLSQLDANPFLDGDQAFTLIGMAPNFTPGVPGELIYYHYQGNTIVIGNVTGTGAVTFEITLSGIQTVTADYFVA